VKTVHEIEQQSDDNQENNDPEADLEVIHDGKPA
jgi:hypothetical protein